MKLPWKLLQMTVNLSGVHHRLQVYISVTSLPLLFYVCLSLTHVCPHRLLPLHAPISVNSVRVYLKLIKKLKCFALHRVVSTTMVYPFFPNLWYNFLCNFDLSFTREILCHLGSFADSSGVPSGPRRAVPHPSSLNLFRIGLRLLMLGTHYKIIGLILDRFLPSDKPR